jgi:hypothetical protein
MTLQQQRSISHEIEYGLDNIISHFDPIILYFPRTIMTKKLGYQKIVHSKEEALQYFKQSNYIDCRINSFRYYSNPNLIFIDIDKKDFKDNKSFENALSITLKNIKEKLNGEPTVLWSGNGYHIIQPIEAIDFENQFNEILSFIYKEFGKDFDLFKEFLRFSKTYLSNGKSDPGFNPSPESCLLRIPGSINGKCLDNRAKRLSGNVKVKIIKEWNNVRSVVPNEYLERFTDYLIQKKIQENNNINQKYNNNNTCNYIPWIEQLLQTPIHESRKLVIWRVLCPYLVNIKRLSDSEATIIMRDWLQKCDLESGRKLDFNPELKIGYELKRVGNYLPPAFNKLKTEPEFSELYQILKDKGAL